MFSITSCGGSANSCRPTRSQKFIVLVSFSFTSNSLPHGLSHVQEEKYPFEGQYVGKSDNSFVLPTDIDSRICPPSAAVGISSAGDDENVSNSNGLCIAHLLTLTPVELIGDGVIKNVLQKSKVTIPDLPPLSACQVFRFSQRQWGRQYLYNFMQNRRQGEKNTDKTTTVSVEEWRKQIFSILESNDTQSAFLLSSPLIYPRKWSLHQDHIIHFDQTGDWNWHDWADRIDGIFKNNFDGASLPCLSRRWVSNVFKENEKNDLARGDKRPRQQSIDSILDEVPLSMGMYLALDVEWLRLQSNVSKIQKMLSILIAQDYHFPSECNSFADRELNVINVNQGVCEFPFKPSITCDAHEKVRMARDKKAVVHSSILAGMAVKDKDSTILVEAIQLLVLSIGHIPKQSFLSEAEERHARFESETLDLMFLVMALEHMLFDICSCRTSCFRERIHRPDGFHKSIFEYTLLPIRQKSNNDGGNHPWLAMRFLLYAFEWMSRYGSCSYKMAEGVCRDVEERKSVERSWIRVKLLSSLIDPWVPKGRGTLHPVDKTNYFLPLKRVGADIPALIFGVAGDDENFDLAIQAFGARAVRQLAIVLASNKTDETEEYRMCAWTDDLPTRRAREKRYSLKMISSILFYSTFDDYSSGFSSDDQLSDRELWSVVNMMVQCAAVWPEAKELFLHHIKRLGQPSEHNIAYLSFLFSATLTQLAYLNDEFSSPYYNLHPPEINALGVQNVGKTKGSTYHPGSNFYLFSPSAPKIGDHLPHELALRQRLRAKHDHFLIELSLELLRTHPFMMGDWSDFLRWQFWSAVLFFFALIVSIFALLGHERGRRRTTVLLPPVYEKTWQIVLFGILFAPIGALVSTDVCLKAVLHNTLMPFEPTYKNLAWISVRALLLITQIGLTQECHTHAASYWANPVAALVVQSMFFASIFQYCVGDDRVRAIFAGAYDADSTSHCGVIVEQELAENMGGGLHVMKQSTVNSPSSKASPMSQSYRTARPRFNHRASALESSLSHFDLENSDVPKSSSAELHELLPKPRSPSIRTRKSPSPPKSPFRRTKTTISPIIRPTFRTTNTVGMLGSPNLNKSSLRDMGPVPAVIHEVTDSIETDKGKDFGPVPAKIPVQRTTSPSARATVSLPSSPIRRPASPPVRFASPPHLPEHVSHSPPRLPKPLRAATPSHQSERSPSGFSLRGLPPPASPTKSILVKSSRRSSPARTHFKLPCCVEPEACAARSFQSTGEYFDVVSQCEGLVTYDRTMLDEYCVHISACDTPKSGRSHFRWSVLFLFLSWLGAYLPYVLPLMTYKVSSYEVAGRARIGALQHSRLVDVASSLGKFDIGPHGASMTIPPAALTKLFVLDIIDFFLLWVLSFEALQYVWAALAIFTNIRKVSRAFTRYFPHYIALKARKNVEVWMHERRDILAFRNRPWIVLRPLVIYLFMRVLYIICTILLSCVRFHGKGLPFWFGITNFWSLRLICFSGVTLIAFVVCWLVQRDVNLEFQSHWILQTSLASQAPLANEGRAYLLTAKQKFATTDANLRLFPRQARARLVATVTVVFACFTFCIRYIEWNV